MGSVVGCTKKLCLEKNINEENLDIKNLENLNTINTNKNEPTKNSNNDNNNEEEKVNEVNEEEEEEEEEDKDKQKEEHKKEINKYKKDISKIVLIQKTFKRNRPSLLSLKSSINKVNTKYIKLKETKKVSYNNIYKRYHTVNFSSTKENKLKKNIT